MELERGDLGISIGTSLAIESIVGTLDSKQEGLKPEGLKRLVVNVRTVYRNIVGSIKDISYSVDDVTEAIKSEMMAIASIISNRSAQQCDVVFYYIELDTYKHQLPFAQFKDLENGTELQRARFQQEKAVFEKLFVDPIWQGVSVLSNGFPDGMPKSAIITHIPMDLFYTANFPQVVLVESHTGAHKLPTQFSTKIVDGAISNIIPFNKLTITLWGDKGNLLKPFPKSSKTLIFNLAQERGWHSLTTRSKVQEDLNQLKDRAFGDWCKRII